MPDQPQAAESEKEGGVTGDRVRLSPPFNGFATANPLLLLPDAAKFLCGGIEQEQRTLRDPEIGAVQIERAALDLVSHKRKRHQVFEAAEHGSLLNSDGEIVHAFVVALFDYFARLDEHRHPFADEIAG